MNEYLTIDSGAYICVLIVFMHNYSVAEMLLR